MTICRNVPVDLYGILTHQSLRSNVKEKPTGKNLPWMRGTNGCSLRQKQGSPSLGMQRMRKNPSSDQCI